MRPIYWIGISVVMWLAIFAVMIISGPWILSLLTDYMERLYSSIPHMIG